MLSRDMNSLDESDGFRRVYSRNCRRTKYGPPDPLLEKITKESGKFSLEMVQVLRTMLRCDSIGNQARRDSGSDVAIAIAPMVLGWGISPGIPVKEATG